MRLFAFALLVAVVGGCAGATTAGGDSSNRRQANVITSEEIGQAQPGQNVFDVIRAMRPNWLQTRGVQSLGSPVPTAAGERASTRADLPIMVYVDGSRSGSTEVLRQILATDVRSLQFLGGTEAASRFGADHTRGAILVTTRRDQ